MILLSEEYNKLGLYKYNHKLNIKIKINGRNIHKKSFLLSQRIFKYWNMLYKIKK